MQEARLARGQRRAGWIAPHAVSVCPFPGFPAQRLDEASHLHPRRRLVHVPAETLAYSPRTLESIRFRSQKDDHSHCSPDVQTVRVAGRHICELAPSFTKLQWDKLEITGNSRNFYFANFQKSLARRPGKTLTSPYGPTDNQNDRCRAILLGKVPKALKNP